MLLYAYLRQRAASHRPITSADRAMLRPMIHVSDNGAAQQVFVRVGRAGLRRLARTVGMTDLSTRGSWGLTLISVADQARFFAMQDRLLGGTYGRYAQSLLSHITSEQSWGIPAAGRAVGYHVAFKGGWLWSIVNQGARLTRRGVSFSLAVLTDGNPSMAYGEATLAGVTARLVG